MSGRLFGPCGGGHHGVYRKDRRHRQYRCQHSRPDADPRCGCRRLNANDADFVVWEAIEQLLTHPENLLAMARDYLGVREGQMETERDQLGAIDTKIAKLERAIRDSVAEGLRAGIDPAVMADAASEIQQELDALTARRAQLLHWQAVNAEKSDRMRTLWDLAEVAHQRLHSP